MSKTTVITGLVRLSYAHIFTASSVEEGGEKKYSCSLLIPKTDTVTLKAIELAVKAAKEEGKSRKWGGKIPNPLKTPLRDGDEEKPDKPEYEGMMFLNCSSKRKPGVVDRELNIIIDPEEEVYSGCWARVQINMFPFAGKSKGVAAGLNNIQKIKDDEQFGGNVEAAADAFEKFEEEGDDMFD